MLMHTFNDEVSGDMAEGLLEVSSVKLSRDGSNLTLSVVNIDSKKEMRLIIDNFEATHPEVNLVGLKLVYAVVSEFKRVFKNKYFNTLLVVLVDDINIEKPLEVKISAKGLVAV